MPLSAGHGSLPCRAFAASLQRKFLLPLMHRCVWLRSCASFSAMGTTARRLFALGQLHNLSVERTSNGEAHLRFFPSAVPPLAAAHLQR